MRGSRQTIDRITGFDAGGLPVVSAYVGVAPDPASRGSVLTRVASLLDRIRPIAYSAALAHEERLSIRRDIARIEDAATGEGWQSGSVAYFSCSAGDFFEAVPLPRAVRDRVEVDVTPLVRPMLSVLDGYRRTCVVLVDRGRARMWELHLGELTELEHLREPTPPKPRYAGDRAEARVRNRAGELTRRHYRRTAAAVSEAFRSNGFDLLVVGGQPYEIPAFVEQLPRRLLGRIAGTVALDPDTATLADIRHRVQDVVDRHEEDAEHRAATGLAEAVAAGQPATLGLSDCLWAGSVAAVDRLLVHDEAVVPGVVCDVDGWLAEAGTVCPLCSAAVRRTPDVIDELVEAVLAGGGTVRHLRVDTALRGHVLGAWLRFPLPPRPTA